MNSYRSQAVQMCCWSIVPVVACSLVVAEPGDLESIDPFEQVNALDPTIVVHEPGADLTVAREIQRLGGEIKYDYQIIDGFAASLPSHSVDQFRSHPEVVAIDPDQVGTIASSELNRSWGVKRIGGGFAHDQGFLGSGVRVAVLDTGVDYDHPEIRHAYAGGFDFANNDPDPFDDHGHGTFVAGIVASARNNRGVVGVTPGVDLFGIKVINANGSVQISDVIAALQWCVDEEIDVVNLSFGFFGDPGSGFRAAFNAAWNDGLVCIASSGGNGSQGVTFPASYDTVIAISATDERNIVASFAGTGVEIELAAPGVNITSLQPGGGYVVGSGTSYAAPHASGAAALVIEAGIVDLNGNDRINDEVRDRLTATAVDLGRPGRDDKYGYGLVNAQAGLHAPLHHFVSRLTRGELARFTVEQAEPNERVYFGYSVAGPDVTLVHPLGVVLGIESPKLVGQRRADADGIARLEVRIPLQAPPGPVWLQAVSVANPSNVVISEIE